MEDEFSDKDRQALKELAEAYRTGKKAFIAAVATAIAGGVIAAVWSAIKNHVMLIAAIASVAITCGVLGCASGDKAPEPDSSRLISEATSRSERRKAELKNTVMEELGKNAVAIQRIASSTANDLELGAKVRETLKKQIKRDDQELTVPEKYLLTFMWVPLLLSVIIVIWGRM